MQEIPTTRHPLGPSTALQRDEWMVVVLLVVLFRCFAPIYIIFPYSSSPASQFSVTRFLKIMSPFAISGKTHGFWYLFFWFGLRLVSGFCFIFIIFGCFEKVARAFLWGVLFCTNRPQTSGLWLGCWAVQDVVPQLSD